MYEIQTLLFSRQWKNMFSDSLNDKPLIFETLELAQAELDCLLSELKIALKHGHINEYNPEIYRIVRSDNEL